MVDVNRAIAIKAIADAANLILRDSLGRSYFTIDTAFLSPTIPGMWHWFATEMRSLVETTRKVSEDTDPHRFARLFLVPEPAECRRRNQDKQWHEVRRLLIGLYDGRCQGLPECAHRGRKLSMSEIEIDHIVPLPHSNNVLLNLRPLCRQCNRLKARLDTTEMPFDALFHAIPSDLATKDVELIMSDQTPAWLSRYRSRPPAMRDYGAQL